MESVVAALKDTPIPTILVVAGIAFLLLSIVGQLAGRITVPPERQRQATIIGGGLLAIGLALHLVPLLQSPRTPPPVEHMPPPRPSTPSGKELPPPPPGEPPSPQPLPGPPAKSSTEEQEPNNDVTTATVITEGTSIRGLIRTGEDQDFFRLNPSGDKTRVTLRTQSSTFMAMVIVYDDLEQVVTMHAATVVEPASFSFESIPGSVYYLMVKPAWSGARGNYELVVRKE